ncbi:hypothetical protein ABBQ38_008737 [Trebouxia sp. C0009 RCD-2024]
MHNAIKNYLKVRDVPVTEAQLLILSLYALLLGFKLCFQSLDLIKFNLKRSK